MKQLHVIEYVDQGWYITIGSKSPWDNLHIRVPKIVGVIINRIVR